MRLIAIALTMTMLALPSARADQYWFAYEGEDFPENQGWDRVHWKERGADRWIDDGTLFSDGRTDNRIYDFYEWVFDGGLDPGPDEIFTMRWRLRVDDVNGYSDPTVLVRSDEAAPDEYYAVGFEYRVDEILSAYEHDKRARIVPGLFHEYALQSTNMRSYELFVDGELLFTGVFREVSGPTVVSFGDGVSGASSLAAWDYVRFGVVPEASGSEAFLFVLSLFPVVLRRVANGRVADE